VLNAAMPGSSGQGGNTEKLEQPTNSSSFFSKSKHAVPFVASAVCDVQVTFF
jgi:hypothetical protein